MTSRRRSCTAWRAWKPRIFLGNDLVWLEDPHNVGRFADQALLRRVLTPRERLMVQVSEDPDRMLWSLWAAKEAAFKAFSRGGPILFSPIQFEIVTAGSAPVRVEWQGRTMDLRWIQGKDWVHAVASDSLASVVAAVGRNPNSDESAAARALAVTELLKAGYAKGAIEGLPPVYRFSGGEIPVSLSHDGPYSAVAFFRVGG